MLKNDRNFFLFGWTTPLGRPGYVKSDDNNPEN